MSGELLGLIKAIIPVLEFIAKKTDNLTDDAIVAVLKQIFGEVKP